MDCMLITAFYLSAKLNLWNDEHQILMVNDRFSNCLKKHLSMYILCIEWLFSEIKKKNKRH